MSDEEYLKLKESIRKLSIEAQEINHSFSNIFQDMSDLDEEIIKLRHSLFEINREVNKYE